MEIRNNKAPRAAVKQCHFAPWQCLTLWSKTELETVQKKAQQTGISPCPLSFFDSWWLGAEDAPSFHSDVCSHGAWGDAAHPARVSQPARELMLAVPYGQRESKPLALNPFPSFSRAVGVPGLQHIMSVLMAWLLLDTFPPITNNSLRSAIYN